jgi:hypothetical protein
MGDITMVAKRMLLGKGIVEKTRIPKSVVVKIWLKKISFRNNKKYLKNLCKYIVGSNQVKFRFSKINFSKKEYNFYVMEIIHMTCDAADFTEKRFNELTEVIGI